MGTTTVGIDIGSTSVKAVAADDEGNVVAHARVPHALLSPEPDLLQHDADEAWRRGPLTALASLGDAGRRARAIGITSMIPSLTAVDQAGVPLTPGLLYGDRRGRTAASTESPVGNGEFTAFLDWTARQAAGAAGYWPAQAVAAVALGGEPVIDFMTAMTAWPLYDGNGWDVGQVAGTTVAPEQLPRIDVSGGAVAEVDGRVFAAGGVDAMGEQIVSSAVEEGDVLVILGATLITWAVVRDAPQVRGLWAVPWHVPGLNAVGGPSNVGGLFLNWSRRLIGADGDPADVDAVPVWHPYPRGERVPLHDPDRRAALHGLDLTMGAGALRRATHEASGFAVRDVLDRAGVSPRRIVATGGGVRDADWVQALADCTGLPVDVVGTPEGAALGAAWTARVALGVEASSADAVRWARTSRRVEPDQTWSRAAARRYDVFRALQAAPGT